MFIQRAAAAASLSLKGGGFMLVRDDIAEAKGISQRLASALKRDASARCGFRG
jgi:hypothetical protein